MIVSIDIGTSYSSISMLDPDGKAQPVDIGTGVSMFGSKYSLPSAVFVEDDGRVLLGQDALNNRMRNPQRFRDEFKRNLGETIPIMLGSRSFLPEELYTEFFRHMKDRAEKVSGEQIELAYLTHPAAYGTSKKNKILSAAKAAGLYDVQLVDEPTAAAMSYCAAGYIKNGQNLLIFDFGGGTFDTALIRYENNSFALLTPPKGLERCGGIDIDRLIFQDMLSKVDSAMLSMLQANNLHYMRFVSQLSELAVKCKHQLSSPEADSFSGYIQVGFDMIPYTLTLEQYNQMIAGMVGQTIQTCRQMLTDAKMKVEDLSAVLLVGGTSRVRLVREMVEQMAGKVPVYCAADLELAVSQGALNYRNYKEAEPELDAEGWYQEGVQYEKVNKPKDAAACYLKAAEMGSAHGQYALAECYQSGYGVEEDEKQAVVWYDRAAHQGDADSQYALGICYLSGLGIQQDAEQAKLWLRNAAQLGHEKAIDELKKLDEQEKRAEIKTLIDVLNNAEKKTRNVVFSGTNTFVEFGEVTVSGHLHGANALMDGEFMVAFDGDGKSLGTCKVRTYDGAEKVLRISEDCNDAQLKLVGFNGRVHDGLDIDYLISMPVSESTYDQVFADLEQDGYYTTRVSYVYEDPNTSIHFDDAYFFYVTEVKDGRIYGRSLMGSLNENSEIYVYSKDKPNSYLKKLKWKEHSENGMNAYFVADCTDVRVGDFLTDCIAPAGYTFKCEKLSFWRYRLTVAVRNKNAADDSDIMNPKTLDEMGQEFSRWGQWGKAFEAYQKAANMDYAPAQYHLADCYERGNGTVVDWSNAKIWYHRAASQGHTAAKDKLKQLEKPKKEFTPREIFRNLARQIPELKSDQHCWIPGLKEEPAWLRRLQYNTNVSDRNSILLAEDTTVFISGKEGLIFTEKGIHAYGGWLAPLNVIDWKTFAKKNLTIDSDDVSARLNGSYIFGSNFLPKGFWPNLHAEIKKLY